MKIDKVIFAKNENPLYENFWELTSEICLKKLGVTPVLFNITDNDSEFYEDKYGLIKNIKKINGVDTGFQSQIVRMFGTKFFQDEVCLTSDIDMLMLNRHWFVDKVKDLDNDSFVIYSSDAYDNQHVRYPICYNAGKGSIYTQILKLNTSFEEYSKRLYSFNRNWSCDELYFTHMLKNSNYDKIVKLERGWNPITKIAINRIDRVDWKWDEANMDKYIDCHCIRPYNEHKDELEKLKKAILKNI